VARPSHDQEPVRLGPLSTAHHIRSVLDVGTAPFADPDDEPQEEVSR
jgi:hypothetical protein